MIRLTITLILSFGMVVLYNNCGAENSYSTGYYGSRYDGSDQTCYSNQNVGYNYTPAQCNGFSSNSISGATATYYEPYSNYPRYDIVRIKLDQIPSSVLSGSSELKFYAWHETCSVSKVKNTYPQTFAIQYVGNGSGAFYPKSSYSSTGTTNVDQAESNFLTLDKATIEKVSSYFLVSPGEFASKFFIIITNLQDSDQALNIGNYPINNNNASYSVDFLLPPYWASPTIYQNTHQSYELIQLHPFINIQNQYSNYSDFYSKSLEFCNSMNI